MRGSAAHIEAFLKFAANSDWKGWNTWRSVAVEDFVELHGVELSGADISKFEFIRVGMCNAKLKSVKAHNCVFQNIGVEETLFERVDFTGSEFRLYMEGNKSKFSYCDLTDTKWPRRFEPEYWDFEDNNLMGVAEPPESGRFWAAYTIWWLSEYNYLNWQGIKGAEAEKFMENVRAALGQTTEHRLWCWSEALAYFAKNDPSNECLRAVGRMLSKWPAMKRLNYSLKCRQIGVNPPV